jgi:hypothetical protein
MPTTHTKTLWLLLLMPCLAAACAHPYIEPSSGPRATIRFVSLKTTGAGDVFVHAVTDERCKADTPLIAVLSGPTPKHHRKRLDMPLGKDYADRDITEVVVEADQPYSFDFYWWIPNQAVGMSNCNVTTTFRPVDGHRYEARYSLGRDACAVDVFEIVKDDDGRYRHEFELSAIRTGSQCKW